MDFEAVRYFSSPTPTPRAVAVGDLDRDGVLDYALADPRSWDLFLYRGDGSGFFRPPDRVIPGPDRQPYAVLAIDLNADGALDFAINSPAGLGSVFLNKGDGSFGARILANFGGDDGSIAAGDFNADGRVDVIGGDPENARLQLTYGDGLGHFAFAGNFSTAASPREIAVADFNRDGRPDVAVACAGAATITVLLNNGLGAFTGASFYPVAPAPQSIASLDVNGDGLVDLAVGSSTTAALSVLHGAGDGTFSATLNVPLDGPSLAVRPGDFNGDGRPDLVVAHGADPPTANVSVLLAGEDGSLAEPITSEAGAGPAGLGVGDFDGDGRMDVLAVNVAGADVALLKGDGTGRFAREYRRALELPPNTIGTADFDRDGNADLAVPSFDPAAAVSGPGALDCGPSNRVSLLFGDGAGAVPREAAHSVACRPGPLLVEDLDSDGAPDVVTGNAGLASPAVPPSLTILMGDSSGGVRARLDLETSGVPIALASGDFNQDGHIDLVAAPMTGPTQLLFQGDGQGGFTAVPGPNLGTRAGAIRAADLDEDGRADLAVALTDLNSVGWLAGTGDFAFGALTTAPVVPSPDRLMVADLNGDGHGDLVTAHGTQLSPANTVSVLYSRGPMSYLPAWSMNAGSTPRGLAAADVDRDGNLDLVVLSGPKRVSVHLGTGSGVTSLPVQFGSGLGSTDMVVADFDNDGLVDFAVVSRTPPTISLLLNRTALGTRLVLRADRTFLTWGAVEDAVAYDIVRGDLVALRSTRDFAAAVRECLADDTTSTMLSAESLPDPGQAFWYLARPVFADGPGTYDSYGFREMMSPDPGLNSSALSCR